MDGFLAAALIAAIAFAILTIFLIIVLVRLHKTLQQTQEFLKKVNGQIDPLTSEAQRLLAHSTELTKTLNEKIDELSPAITNLVENTTEITEAVRDELDNISALTNSFTPLSHSLSNIGSALEGFTSHWANKDYKRSHSEQDYPRHEFTWTSSSHRNGFHPHDSDEDDEPEEKPIFDKVINIIELIAMGFNTWREHKKRR